VWEAVAAAVMVVVVAAVMVVVVAVEVVVVVAAAAAARVVAAVVAAVAMAVVVAVVLWVAVAVAVGAHDRELHASVGCCGTIQATQDLRSRSIWRPQRTGTIWGSYVSSPCGLANPQRP